MKLESMTTRLPCRRAKQMRGVSLVELMIALVLGLILTGGAITVFISNKETFQTAEGLGRVQESARAVFELVARDLRGAGASACKDALPLENVLGNAGTAWWSPADGTFGQGFVLGLGGSTASAAANFGGAVGERVSGTHAFQVLTAVSPVHAVRTHTNGASPITLNTINHGFRAGDIAVVCDYDHATIFQVTAASNGVDANIAHTATGTPGNAVAALGMAGATYRFGCFEGRLNCSDTRQWPGFVARLRAATWYVGNNSRGGRSLFRSELVTAAAGIVAQTNVVEIADGVDSVDFDYLQGGSYRDASAVTDWAGVSAARLTLNMQSPEAVSSAGNRITRTFTHTVTMRSRAP